MTYRNMFPAALHASQAHPRAHFPYAPFAYRPLVYTPMDTYEVIGNENALAHMGAIAGHHTLGETRELLAATDFRFKKIEEAFVELRGKQDLDPNTHARLEEDWLVLLKKWSEARKQIVQGMGVKAAAFPVLPASVIPTEDEWVQLLAFTQGQELETGSLQDVTRRLEQILGRPILFEGQPAQTAPDLDLAVFQELDASIRAGEAAAKEAEKALTSPTAIAIGGTLLFIGGVVAVIALLPEIRAVGSLFGSRK